MRRGLNSSSLGTGQEMVHNGITISECRNQMHAAAAAAIINKTKIESCVALHSIEYPIHKALRWRTT
ncbi:unnamed protein product [Brugia pahangi]|uniref:Uncharacterized protein n=1 Tax=Brugia pahangi TaxID=6280 RepID=A0A0N4T3U1_BRUPA|nr:unnamed protein product [Brugia pahangi]